MEGRGGGGMASSMALLRHVGPECFFFFTFSGRGDKAVKFKMSPNALANARTTPLPLLYRYLKDPCQNSRGFPHRVGKHTKVQPRHLGYPAAAGPSSPAG